MIDIIHCIYKGLFRLNKIIIHIMTHSKGTLHNRVKSRQETERMVDGWCKDGLKGLVWRMATEVSCLIWLGRASQREGTTAANCQLPQVWGLVFAVSQGIWIWGPEAEGGVVPSEEIQEVRWVTALEGFVAGIIIFLNQILCSFVWRSGVKWGGQLWMYWSFYVV